MGSMPLAMMVSMMAWYLHQHQHQRQWWQQHRHQHQWQQEHEHQHRQQQQQRTGSPRSHTLLAKCMTWQSQRSRQREFRTQIAEPNAIWQQVTSVAGKMHTSSRS